MPVRGLGHNWRIVDAKLPLDEVAASQLRTEVDAADRVLGAPYPDLSLLARLHDKLAAMLQYLEEKPGVVAAAAAVIAALSAVLMALMEYIKLFIV